MGLTVWIAGGTALVLSMFPLTVLHLAEGPMAAKSLGHYLSGKVGAGPRGVVSRARTWPVRARLSSVDDFANRSVRASGVNPVRKAAVGGCHAVTIRQLGDPSAKPGTIEPSMQRQLSGLIDPATIPVASPIIAEAAPAWVGRAGIVAELSAAGPAWGHRRVLMKDGNDVPVMVDMRDPLMRSEARPRQGECPPCACRLPRDGGP